MHECREQGEKKKTKKQIKNKPLRKDNNRPEQKMPLSNNLSCNVSNWEKLKQKNKTPEVQQFISESVVQMELQ